MITILDIAPVIDEQYLKARVMMTDPKQDAREGERQLQLVMFCKGQVADNLAADGVVDMDNLLSSLDATLESLQQGPGGAPDSVVAILEGCRKLQAEKGQSDAPAPKGLAGWWAGRKTARLLSEYLVTI